MQLLHPPARAPPPLCSPAFSPWLHLIGIQGIPGPGMFSLVADYGSEEEEEEEEEEQATSAEGVLAVEVPTRAAEVCVGSSLRQESPPAIAIEVTQDRLQSEHEPDAGMAGTAMEGSGQAPFRPASEKRDRAQRLSKIAFNMHELDDPSALEFFLKSHHIRERGSCLRKQPTREHQTRHDGGDEHGTEEPEDGAREEDEEVQFARKKEEFDRFVRGEISTEDLLSGVAASLSEGDIGGKRRGKRSRWDERQ